MGIQTIKWYTIKYINSQVAWWKHYETWNRLKMCAIQLSKSLTHFSGWSNSQFRDKILLIRVWNVQNLWDEKGLKWNLIFLIFRKFRHVLDVNYFDYIDMMATTSILVFMKRNLCWKIRRNVWIQWKRNALGECIIAIMLLIGVWVCWELKRQ